MSIRTCSVLVSGSTTIGRLAQYIGTYQGNTGAPSHPSGSRELNGLEGEVIHFGLGSFCFPSGASSTPSGSIDDMAHRIELHHARRGEGWRTVEVPTRLAEVVRQESAPRASLLVDCLTVTHRDLP